jgi:amidophosphoribosyltransferase
MCIFEHIYIARPDSVIEGASVYEARKEAGRYLAKQSPVEADVVIAVPDSGIGAAIGYSEQSGIPYEVGLMKNRYVARTFIQPTQQMRENAVRIKLNVLKSVVKGKRVVMVDDSIVRGTTSNRIVKLLREAGAKEVHMRVAAPPYLYPCYFGTDVGSTSELIAVGKTVEEMRDIIGVDSLDFITLENILKSPIGSKTEFCTACFNGDYPLDVSEFTTKSENKSFIKNWEK